MATYSGLELKKEINKRKVEYINCMIFLDKNNIALSEANVLKNGINHKVLFFVTSFPQQFCKKLIEKNEADNVRIVVVKSEILYKEDCLRTYYDCYYKNKLSTGLMTRHNVLSFLSLFKSAVPTSYSAEGNINYLFRAKNQPPNIPTHPGACIWWDGVVNPKYIVRLLDVETFINFGPVISESLLYYLDDSDVGEYDDYENYEQEIDLLLEEALSRDMQFGTNEYDKLFKQYRDPKRYDQDSNECYEEESESECEYLYPPFWEDYEERLSNDLLDLGYLEDIKEEDIYKR